MTGAEERTTEELIIGAVLVHPKIADQLSRLRPDHFGEIRLSEAWRSVCALRDSNAPVDAVAVWEDLRRRDRAKVFEQHGGADGLALLMAKVVTVESMEWHARRVILGARRRAWLGFARKLAVEAADEGADSEDVLEQAEREAARLSVHDDHEGGPQLIRPTLKALRDIIERRSENQGDNALTGISWGFGSMDFYTQGLHEQEFIIIAARPRMGKTTLTMNSLGHVAQAGVPALMISLEMSARSIVEKMVSAVSGVPAWELRSGRMRGSESWVKVGGAMSRMSTWPLWIDERGGLDMTEIRATIRRWLTENAKARCAECTTAGATACTHRVVAIDYLQLIHPATSDRRRSLSREQEVSEISRGLKALAKELRLPLVVLAQLSRKLEERADKRPILSDLRESGSLEADADMVAFIHREHEYDQEADPALAEIIIAKQREGEGGRFRLTWDGKRQRFLNRTDAEKEADKQEAEGKPRSKKQGDKKPKNGGWHPYAPGTDD